MGCRPNPALAPAGFEITNPAPAGFEKIKSGATLVSMLCTWSLKN